MHNFACIKCLQDLHLHQTGQLLSSVGVLTCRLSAGYFENFRLQVPKQPTTWDPKLGGNIFPERRRIVSTKWSGSSAGEVSVLTGRHWNLSATELLVQPLMYGKFMEYGHNGELQMHCFHACTHCNPACNSFSGASEGPAFRLMRHKSHPRHKHAGESGVKDALHVRETLEAKVWMCGAAGNDGIGLVQA